jgi:hypothetical protein
MCAFVLAANVHVSGDLILSNYSDLWKQKHVKIV